MRLSRHRILTSLCLAGLSAIASPSAHGITIQIDYSFDTNGPFFDTPEKRDALQFAASFFEELLVDSLTAIAPSGTNQWTPSFVHPGTGRTATVEGLEVGEDTLIIFAGGRDLPGELRAVGGFGAVSARGSAEWVSTAISRGEANTIGPDATDFAPWGGSIAFDTTQDDGSPQNWNFDPQMTPAQNQPDFVSLALHELGHALGLGLSDSWKRWVDPANNEFLGPASVEVAGGPVKLDTRLGTPHVHWDQPATSRIFPMGSFQTAVMVPQSAGRRQFTELDVAGLVDVGWEIASPPPTLQPGDANRDQMFDQFDIIQVLQRGKYLSGDLATWGEGDWNGGPGGTIDMPPEGDGLFDQLDIVAALQAGNYLAQATAMGRQKVFAARLLPSRPTASTPQPGGLALWATAWLWLIGSRSTCRSELATD